MTTPLFVPDGGRFVPTGFTRGPWNPGLMHGGAVAVLVAEVLQRQVDSRYQPTRLTLDLLRPVPVVPLTVDSRLVRAGDRLAVAECVMTAGDREVAGATLLSLRPEPLSGCEPQPLGPPADSPEQAADLWDLSDQAEAFIGGGMSFRFVPRDGALAGGAMWLDLHRPVFPDTPASPLARVAAAADVPSAVADGAHYDNVGFINADISVHLHRPAVGEWIRVTATSRWETSGIGVVEGSVSDVNGSVGRLGQALVLAAGLTPP